MHERVAPVERGSETSSDQVDVAAGSLLSAGKEAASRVATGPTRESGSAASWASRALVTEEGSGARSPVLGSPLSGGIWADQPKRSGWAFDPKTPIPTVSG